MDATNTTIGRRCPVCQLWERHRAVCLDFLRHPPEALLSPSAFVAYFGPEPAHAFMLQNGKPRMRLQELDYFAPGYTYPRTTIQADVQRIPLQNNSLDGAIILHVLEHVLQWRLAVQELHRVLRPGGFVQHETPCYGRGESSGRGVISGAASTPTEEDCVATRASGTAGSLCRQHDHMWGLDCRKALWRAFEELEGFSCYHTPFDLKAHESVRFIGYSEPRKGSRFRCTKRTTG